MPCCHSVGFISFRDSFPCPTPSQLQVNGWGLATFCPSCQYYGVRQPPCKPGAAARRTCYINPRKRAARCLTCRCGNGPRDHVPCPRRVEDSSHQLLFCNPLLAPHNRSTSASRKHAQEAVQILFLSLPFPRRSGFRRQGNVSVTSESVVVPHGPPFMMTNGLAKRHGP